MNKEQKMNKFAYIFVALLILSNYLISAEYNVDKNRKNSVKFISDAPIEDFEGVTDNIDGYLIGDPSDFSKESELYFEVQLNTLETGIGLRDRHMKENYLHTNKYPLASFKGEIIETKKSSNGFDVVVKGEMSIHGKKVKLSVKGDLNSINNGYEVKCKFIVPLSDYNIEVPSLMFQKIDENMKLELKFYLTKVS